MIRIIKNSEIELLKGNFNITIINAILNGIPYIAICFTMYKKVSDANIMDVSGDVQYKSTSGSLDAENIAGEISVALTSGNARLSNIGSLGSLKFTSGNIKAENAGLGNNTSFNGTSGSFKVQTPSNLKAYNFSLKASSGNVKVGNVSTGKSLEMDNGSGPWVKGSISSGNITIEN
jgi:hypothetical protein